MEYTNWNEMRRHYPHVETETRKVTCSDNVARVMALPVKVWAHADELVINGFWQDLQPEIDLCFTIARDEKPADMALTIAFEQIFHRHVLDAMTNCEALFEDMNISRIEWIPQPNNPPLKILHRKPCNVVAFR